MSLAAVYAMAIRVRGRRRRRLCWACSSCRRRRQDRRRQTVKVVAVRFEQALDSVRGAAPLAVMRRCQPGDQFGDLLAGSLPFQHESRADTRRDVSDNGEKSAAGQCRHRFAAGDFRMLDLCLTGEPHAVLPVWKTLKEPPIALSDAVGPTRLLPQLPSPRPGNPNRGRAAGVGCLSGSHCTALPSLVCSASDSEPGGALGCGCAGAGAAGGTSVTSTSLPQVRQPGRGLRANISSLTKFG